MHPTISDLASRTMADKRKPKRWISKAVPESRKGVFKEKAERAGETTREFAKEHDGSKGALGKEARLAETLMGLPKKRKSIYSEASRKKMEA